MSTVPEFKVEIFAPLVVEFDGEAGCWYAACPHLDIVRDGQTEEEAIAMLDDAFCIMVNYRWEKGTLESYLQGLGFRMSRIWEMNNTEIVRCYAPRYDAETQLAQKSSARGTLEFVRKLVPSGDTGVCQVV